MIVPFRAAFLSCDAALTCIATLSCYSALFYCLLILQWTFTLFNNLSNIPQVCVRLSWRETCDPTSLLETALCRRLYVWMRHQSGSRRSAVLYARLKHLVIHKGNIRHHIGWHGLFYWKCIAIVSALLLKILSIHYQYTWHTLGFLWYCSQGQMYIFITAVVSLYW